MPSDSSRNPAEDSRIESWKEIAAFFGRDERTVKRWEKTRRLPIHRLPGEKGGVFAYKLELTAWLNSAASERLASQAAAPEEDSESIVTVSAQSSQAQSNSQPTGETTTESASFSTEQNLSTSAPVISAGRRRGDTKGRSQKTLLLVAASIVAALLLVYPAIRHFLNRSAQAGTPGNAVLSSGLRQAGNQAGKISGDPAARELYLKGRYYWNHRTDASLKLAVEAFTQAVVRDPQYAPAYAGLADTYNLMTQYSFMPQAQAFPLALTAARKAVALDDSLSEAHRALAFGLFYWEWKTEDAFREYQRAIDLDPNDVEAHNWYATSLLVANQLPRAVEQIAKARELDPTSRIVVANQALILANGGQSITGIARLKELEATEPDFLAPPQYLAEIYFGERNYPEYLAQLERVANTSHDPDKMALASAARRGWSRAGSHGMLESLRATYQASFQAGKSSGYDLAQVCAILGDKPAANRYLQAAFDARDFNAMQARFGEFNQAMQGDPAFEEMKRQITLRMSRPVATIASSHP